MSSPRLAILAMLLVALVGCLHQPQPAGVEMASQGAQPTADAESASPSNAEAVLVNTYQTAHANQDVEAILKLYWFGSADDEMRLTIRENAAAELRCPLKDIKIEPVEPGKHGPREEGGIRWRPSLEVTALLTANFDTSRAPVGGYHTEQVQLTVGRRSGRCYFTVPLRD